MTVSREAIRRAAEAAGAAAPLIRLPLGGRRWRGPAGARSGRSAGSSVDFMEHRPYMPGDDPRHIDWRATARTGQPSLKLFVEEVSPAVDILLDGSESMALSGEKLARTLECLFVLMGAARRENAPCRVFAAAPRERGGGSAQVRELARGELESGWEMTGLGPPPAEQVPWRRSGLRVFLSDLLYPAEPRAILGRLAAPGAAVLVLAPFDRAEAGPDWERMELVEDCESGRRFEIARSQRTRSAYDRAYRGHFELWARAAAAAGAALWRVDSGLPLAQALLGEGSPLGPEAE